MIVSILEWLAAAGLKDLVDKICSEISIWYISKQNKNTLANIADAADFAARAETDVDRYNAATRWQVVLGSKRFTN